MKKIIGFCGACIAFYIGAGFATMQEVMQYEASYGSRYWIVVLVTALVYIYTNISFATNGNISKIERGGEIFSLYCGKKIGAFYDAFCAFFCYMCFIVMCGGANSTATEQWNLPNGVGAIILTIAVVATVIMDLDGILKVLNKIGPIIIVTILAIAVISTMRPVEPFQSGLWKIDSGNYEIAQVGNNNPVASGVSYAGFVILWFAPFISEIGSKNKLIINMLNCRPVQAEQYAGWAHGMHPLLSSKYERMLLVWKGAQVMPNTHWNSMQQWIASQMFDVYKKEKWLRNPKDILFESCTSENKAIVVDLWTLYFFVKVQAQEVMSHFKTIYITYDTVSMALQEINQVNDDDIRRVLIHLQREGNVKLLSPTLEQQLTVRNPSYNFMEVHSACLLAQELNCPAFVGEFRFEIPEQLRSKVIRPDNLKEVMDCVMDKKLLEAE